MNRRGGWDKLLLFILLLVAGTGCDGLGSGEERPDDAGDLLYVCNQAAATISVIDTEINDVIHTLELTDYGFSETAKPHHVVVDPEGQFFYVSLINEDQVAKFSREDLLAGRSALVGTANFEAPGMLAVHPTRDRLYATHTMSLSAEEAPSTVAVIQTASMERTQIVDVGLDHPHGIAVHPDGRYVYVSDLAGNRLAAVDTEQENEVTRRTVGGDRLQRYVHLAISPNGEEMYVTGQSAGQVQVFEVDENQTHPVLAQTIDVESEPWHPAFTPDGSAVYFGNKAAGTVTVIDADTRVVRLIESGVLAQPHGSAVSPDGRYVYVSNNVEDGTIAVIDAEGQAVVKVIDVGESPTGIGTR